MFTFSIPDSTLRRLTSLASVGVAGTLILTKLAAYFQTHSVALLSSLLDSGVDLLSSLITAYGVAQALRPPDREHRFGHGKAESLAALAQAAFITGGAALLLVEAFERFRAPQAITNTSLGYGVMTLAIVLTLLLLALQSYTVKRTNSLAIAADRMHYLGDIAINLSVMATFALHEYWGLNWADPLFAILIALSLLVNAVQIGRRSLNVLMDAELPDAQRAEIISLAKTVEGVKGVHDLRTRSDSERPFIDMHVEMCPRLPLIEAHAIAEAVMEKVRTAFPKADILVHEDPKGVIEPRLDTEIEKEIR